MLFWKPEKVQRQGCPFKTLKVVIEEDTGLGSDDLIKAANVGQVTTKWMNKVKPLYCLPNIVSSG